MVNIPIRTEKPFMKIPKFSESDIVVKPNLNSQTELDRSRKKKLMVTKLMYDPSKMGSARPEHVAEERFDI